MKKPEENKAYVLSEDKFSPEHHCKNRVYQVIILQEDYSDEDEDEAPTTEGTKEETTMELSMISIVGLMGNDTMKVKGRLMGEEVVILIDSEPTISFHHKQYVIGHTNYHNNPLQGLHR